METITMAQILGLLAKIKRAYPNFVNIVKRSPHTNQVQSSPTADLWYERLNMNGITFDRALSAVDYHIDTSDFEPKISSIINYQWRNGSEHSLYEVQQRQREQDILELKQYHSSEDVKPMPDHIRKRIERIAGAEAGDLYES
ncbi:hypothetical protein [Paenibacillus sp. Marseille-Q4541]|uniref:hypothetical protein n=1 Tax=Paenibacillus sp. Marseille-Q4541 TaxID=2831522 RepID=UPI001BA993A9|nr:hypothetical protein [Paenibacillus sp. Marseille-Q4541]